MSKAFIAEVIQNSAEITGVAANRAAAELIEAIVKEMKKNGKFTLPSFGTFTVRNRGRDQGQGRQDGALQGLAEPEEDGLRGIVRF
jgi:DNA-binding protein HU-beta